MLDIRNIPKARVEGLMCPYQCRIRNTLQIHVNHSHKFDEMYVCVCVFQLQYPVEGGKVSKFQKRKVLAAGRGNWSAL